MIATNSAHRARRGAILLVLAAAATSCSGDRRGATYVKMYDNAYGAAIVRVAPGTRVQFENFGRNDHNVVVADSANAPFPTNPPHVPPGGTQPLTLQTPGVYTFYCSFHGTPDGRGMAGVIVVGDAAYTPPGKGAVQPADSASGVTRAVPSKYPTIQSAVDAAAPGDLVLIDSGTYREEVTVTTPSLVLRGVDRNEVIIDGEFVRGNGVSVLANGVAVENMTARNAVLNGFFWTGVTGYRGSYLTAHNNGDYGIYAFGATDGVIEDSYASGSPDAGFYVGQCYPCRTVIRRVTAEHNALGYSGTNSGGELFIVSSIFRNNRSGLVPSSLDSELDPPQRETVIAANLIASNNNRATPAGGLTPLGLGNGVIIAGGRRNEVRGNVIVDHEAHGVLVSPLYDRNFWPALDNVIANNFVARSGRADIGVGGPLTRGTCVSGNNAESTAPAGLQREDRRGVPCVPAPWYLQQGLAVPAMLAIRQYRAGSITWPDYKKQPAPGPQPSMPNARTAAARPATHPFAEARALVDAAPLPADALLARAEVQRARGEVAEMTPEITATHSPRTGVTSWWPVRVIGVVFLLAFVGACFTLVTRRASPFALRDWRLYAASGFALVGWWITSLVLDVMRHVGF